MTTTTPYREAKEAFVAGLSGSSVHTINAVSLTALSTYAAWACLRTRAPAHAALLPLQLALLIAPILLATTALAGRPLLLNALLAAAAGALLRMYPHHDSLATRRYGWALFASPSSGAEKRRTVSKGKSKKQRDRDTADPRAPFLPAYERKNDPDDEDSHAYSEAERTGPEADEDSSEDEDKLRGVSSTASITGQESRRSLHLRHRRSRSRGSGSLSISLSKEAVADLYADGEGGAVTSAFRLARQGVASSTVSQHALTAFQSMQSHQQAENAHLFTPIPPSSADARATPEGSARSADASSDRVSQQQHARRGRRKHKRHWSKAYLDSEGQEHEDPSAAGLGAGEVGGSAHAYSPQGAESDNAELSRLPASGYRIGRPHAAGRDPATVAEEPEEEPFRVSVESATDSGRSGASSPHTKADDPHHWSGREDSSIAAESKGLSSSGAQLQADGSNSAELAVKIAMPVRPFLTIYRAHMMLMTIICILAVDFPIFPRAFAKCETWGTSLMDMGVGSFVFSLGLVSAAPELRRSVLRAIQRHRTSTFTTSPALSSEPTLLAQLAQDVRRSLPVLVLGLVRVLLVKSTEYPEHVSEYGVHWNFFITLGLLPCVGTLVRAGLVAVLPSSSNAPSGASAGAGASTSGRRRRQEGGYSLRMMGAALTLGIVFQLCLWLTPLQEWAISNALDRSRGLLTANKEGIVSLPGYVVLYLLGLDLGAYVLPADPYLAHRLRSKRQLRSRRERMEGDESVAVAGGVVLSGATGASGTSGARSHSRTSSLGSIAYGHALPDVDSAGGPRKRTSEEVVSGGGAGAGPSVHFASPSSLPHGHGRGHGSNASVSSLAGASPLHVHVLRHRSNGSVSRLSTSSDGLSSILLHAGSGSGGGAAQAGASPAGPGGSMGGNGTAAIRAPRSHSDKLAMVLFSFASMWWGLYFLLWLCGAQPSRRIANIMYVIWVSAYNTSFLLGYLLIHMCLLEPLERAGIERAAQRSAAELVSATQSDRAGPASSEAGGPKGASGATVAEKVQHVVSLDAVLRKEGTTPLLFELLNRHALLVFLVANVLTGIINLSMQTMYVPDLAALVVIALYLAACFASAIALDRFRIRIRL